MLYHTSNTFQSTASEISFDVLLMKLGMKEFLKYRDLQETELNELLCRRKLLIGGRRSQIQDGRTVEKTCRASTTFSPILRRLVSTQVLLCNKQLIIFLTFGVSQVTFAVTVAIKSYYVFLKKTKLLQVVQCYEIPEQLPREFKNLILQETKVIE